MSHCPARNEARAGGVAPVAVGGDLAAVRGAAPDEVRRTRPDKTTLPMEVPSMGQLVQIFGSVLIQDYSI